MALVKCREFMFPVEKFLSTSGTRVNKAFPRFDSMECHVLKLDFASARANSMPTENQSKTSHKRQNVGSNRSLQHEIFPSGLPSKYYSRPTGFDYGDRTRPGFLPVVWS